MNMLGTIKFYKTFSKSASKFGGRRISKNISLGLLTVYFTPLSFLSTPYFKLYVGFFRVDKVSSSKNAAKLCLLTNNKQKIDCTCGQINKM
jgi:hypothetical protein